MLGKRALLTDKLGNMYTHDDDMPTPEEQATTLDIYGMSHCHSPIVCSLPDDPADRACGRNFEVREGFVSFSDFQRSNPGGWWGAAAYSVSDSSDKDAVPHVLYEMLCGRISPGIDRIALIPLGNAADHNIQDVLDALASKMIACVWDSPALGFCSLPQPGLDVADSHALPRIAGCLPLVPGTFPEYDKLVPQAAIDNLGIRYIFDRVLELNQKHSSDSFHLSAEPWDMEAKKIQFENEMRRRTFGAFHMPSISPTALQADMGNARFLCPWGGFSPDVEELLEQTSAICSEWDSLFSSLRIKLCFPASASSETPGATPMIPDDLIELGKASQRFSSKIISACSSSKMTRVAKKEEIENPARERELSLPAALPNELFVPFHDLDNRFPNAGPLTGEAAKLPDIVMRAISVNGTGASIASNSWEFPVAALDALSAGKPAYTVLREAPHPCCEHAMVAFMCGLFPSDAAVIIVATKTSKNTRERYSCELPDIFARDGAPIVFDESGKFAPKMNVGRYFHNNTYANLGYLSDDVPLVPEIYEEAANLWEEELAARGEAIVFGKGRKRSDISLTQAARILSEGRIELELGRASHGPARSLEHRCRFTPLSFFPTLHSAMPHHRKAEELTRLAMLACIWREAVNRHPFLMADSSFPSTDDPTLLERIGLMTGAYTMVEKYYSGTPLENILDEDSCTRIIDWLAMTMGTLAITCTI